MVGRERGERDTDRQTERETDTETERRQTKRHREIEKRRMSDKGRGSK